jgi:photosystem II stability/assembly factor-like uncharacterized protein
MKLSGLKRIVLQVLFVLLSSSQLPDGNTQVGQPESGGLMDTITAIAIDPQNTRRLYAGSRLGTYLSTDGGMSWRLLTGSPAFPTALLVNPSKPHTIFASIYDERDDGVFKSEDGGATWAKMLHVVGIWTLAVDPQNGDTLYVGAGYGDIGSEPGLYQSTDGGTTWRGLFGASVYSLAVDPHNPTTIYAGSHGGIYKGAKGVFTFRPTDSRASHVSSVAIDVQTPTTVYAASNVIYPATGLSGIYKSTDGGDTWNRVMEGDGTVSKLIVDPSNSNIVYATISRVSLSRGGSLLKSTDGGSTWARSPVLEGTNIFSMAIDPQDTNTLYVGTASGVWKSINGGLSWSTNPLLTLTAVRRDARGYCVGDSWTLRFGPASPDTPVQLQGISNDVPWTVQEWGVTNGVGEYVESGTFAAGAEGRHSLRVMSNLGASNTVDFAVTNCSPPLR